jgi:hypothetical protein
MSFLLLRRLEVNETGKLERSSTVRRYKERNDAAVALPQTTHLIFCTFRDSFKRGWSGVVRFGLGVGHGYPLIALAWSRDLLTFFQKAYRVLSCICALYKGRFTGERANAATHGEDFCEKPQTEGEKTGTGFYQNT